MPITQLMGYIYIHIYIDKVNEVFQQLNLINSWGKNARITQELSSYWFNPRAMHLGASIFKTSLGTYIYRHPLQWILDKLCLKSKFIKYLLNLLKSHLVSI